MPTPGLLSLALVPPPAAPVVPEVKPNLESVVVDDEQSKQSCVGLECINGDEVLLGELFV